MKKVLLICAAMMLGVVAACEAEEEPAPTPFLPLPGTPDAAADAAEGDAGSTEPGDTVVAEDTATEDTAVEDVAVEITETDAVADGASDATVEEVQEEDVAPSDIFEPGTTEGACKLAGNPSAAKFAGVQDQTLVLKKAITDCYKTGAMEGEEFYSCLREMVVEAYGCTEDCAQCFAARADCMKTFCFGGCIHTSTADEEDCDQCQADNYCLNPFETCTGLAVF